MEKTLFNTGNVKKFFNTTTEGLSGGDAALVKTLNGNFGDSAYAVAQKYSESPWIAQPIIGGMVQSYGLAVSAIVHGTPGNC